MAKDIEEKIGAMSQKNCHGLKYKYPLKNYRVHEMPTGDQLPPHYLVIHKTSTSFELSYDFRFQNNHSSISNKCLQTFKSCKYFHLTHGLTCNKSTSSSTIKILKNI